MNEKTFCNQFRVSGLFVCCRRFNFWWRWGESNSCPKTSPQGFLRVQLVFWHSLVTTPNNRLSNLVAFYVWQLKGVGCSQEPLVDAQPIAVVLNRGASCIKQLKQLYCCCLFLSLKLLKWCPTTTRLPRFVIPVETFTSPYGQCRWHCGEMFAVQTWNSSCDEWNFAYAKWDFYLVDKITVCLHPWALIAFSSVRCQRPLAIFVGYWYRHRFRW